MLRYSMKPTSETALIAALCGMRRAAGILNTHLESCKYNLGTFALFAIAFCTSVKCYSSVEHVWHDLTDFDLVWMEDVPEIAEESQGYLATSA